MWHFHFTAVYITHKVLYFKRGVNGSLASILNSFVKYEFFQHPNYGVYGIIALKSILE